MRSLNSSGLSTPQKRKFGFQELQGSVLPSVVNTATTAAPFTSPLSPDLNVLVSPNRPSEVCVLLKQCNNARSEALGLSNIHLLHSHHLSYPI
jgi:hypothetical protein